MSNQALLAALNQVQAWELTGLIQYMQHGLLVTGPLRPVYKKFFTEMSEEAHEHVGLVGDKIVSLGGIPTVEPKLVRQSTSLTEMIKQDLELEEAALDAYLEAWEEAKKVGHRPTVFWLEERISEEQGHIEELAKIARTTQIDLSEVASDEASEVG